MTKASRGSALGVYPPGRPLIGVVQLPGSKSITNRALLLAGLARGRSRLTGALKSDDTRYMVQALLRRNPEAMLLSRRCEPWA